MTAYGEGDFAPIVRRVSEAAVAAVFNGRELVSELHTVRAEWNDKITARSDSAVWQIADLLRRRPVINTTLLTEELGIASKHARADTSNPCRGQASSSRPARAHAAASGARQKSSQHSTPVPTARAGTVTGKPADSRM
jgi:hypothetical protein